MVGCGKMLVIYMALKLTDHIVLTFPISYLSTHNQLLRAALYLCDSSHGDVKVFFFFWKYESRSEPEECKDCA